MSNSKEWFVDWFNTPYYHILYNHRNDNEAQFFIKNLMNFIQPKIKTEVPVVLDLACGKGRHSVFLNQLGYKVMGLDLSKNSIAHAQQFENENLTFAVHDMRKPFPQQFDLILNLFTSFGYFEDDEQDIKVLLNIKNALMSNGLAVIDFMNINLALQNRIEKEIIHKEGINFNIQRKIENNFIVKTISFEDKGIKHQYQERVKLLNLEKIENYLKEVNLLKKHLFGDYNLTTFDPQTSKRLILVLG